jgi:ubiquilin
MQELQSTGLFPGLPGGMGSAPSGGGPLGGAAMPDMGALMGMLGGGGLGGLGGAPPPPANPEEAYASQLAQLQEMGFYDREANLRALLAAGGNVNAAVERLLSSM